MATRCARGKAPPAAWSCPRPCRACVGGPAGGALAWVGGGALLGCAEAGLLRAPVPSRLPVCRCRPSWARELTPYASPAQASLRRPCPGRAALQAWVKARQASDFSAFAPVLQEWVELRREKAALVDPDV